MFRNGRKSLLIDKHIDEVWDEIVPAITKIRDELPWRDWTMQDLHDSCSGGESRIFVREDTPPSEFFFVLRITNSSAGKVLFLWLAWSPDTPLKQCPLFFEEIEKIGKQNECEAIEFVTAHQWLVDYSARFGYHKKMYNVRKELTDEGEDPE